MTIANQEIPLHVEHVALPEVRRRDRGIVAGLPAAVAYSGERPEKPRSVTLDGATDLSGEVAEDVPGVGNAIGLRVAAGEAVALHEKVGASTELVAALLGDDVEDPTGGIAELSRCTDADYLDFFDHIGVDAPPGGAGLGSAGLDAVDVPRVRLLVRAEGHRSVTAATGGDGAHPRGELNVVVEIPVRRQVLDDLVLEARARR